MLLHGEGFEALGVTSGNAAVGIDQDYPSSSTHVSLTRIQDGRFGGHCLSHEASGDAYVTTGNLGNLATVITGVAMRVTNTLSDYRVLSLREEDNATEGINVRVTSGGALAVYLGNSLIATSGTTPITPNNWYYIELKVLVNGSGDYEVRVDGSNVLSGSTDTQAGANEYANRVRLHAGLASASRQVQFDDWYVCDDSGSINNDFLGTRRIITYFGTADGDSSQLTPDSGDNYARVNENPRDGDTSYVESGTSGHLDLYQMDTVTFSAINGVIVEAVVRKTDAPDMGAHLVAKVGGTEYPGSAIPVTDSDYTTIRRVLETNPDTAGTWTDAEINASQFGIEVE